jgi:membrane-bound lytic murein transglycosylase B
MKLTKILLLLLSLSTLLSAKYTNCKFGNKDYTDVCKKVVKHGVSYKYANQFLLSYTKTKKFDEISWKYLQPKHIRTHRESEKKANNVLVKYVPDILTNLNKYKNVYAMAEKKYGVNREIIAAILMKETKLGKIHPTHDAFTVFNTIVVRTKPQTSRQKWLLKMGKTNMATIIEYCYKANLKPKECNLPSSYAGAVGIPQFMPNSFIYADSYTNKTPDLTKMEDAILSAARFLNKKSAFTSLIEWKDMPNVPSVEADWYEYAYRHKNASFVYEKSKSGKKYSCFTKDKEELQYMKKYTKKIMRYNNSSNYAVGVIRLAYDAHKLLQGED